MKPADTVDIYTFAERDCFRDADGNVAPDNDFLLSHIGNAKPLAASATYVTQHQPDGTTVRYLRHMETVYE